jgi:hypothetical protein
MAKRRIKGKSKHTLETKGLPSASRFDSEFRCLGKRALRKRLPEEEDSAAAAAGQRIHKALEISDIEPLSKSEGRTASRIMYGEGEIVHEFGFEGAEVNFETRMWDVDADFNRLWSARVDRHDWLKHERRVLVLDYKTGWGLPPPLEINWQVRSEAALLCEMYDALEVVIGLIHPHHPDSLWEAKAYSRNELLGLLDTVRHNVATIQLPDQPRTPGPIQCQWCPAKRVCPEYLAASEKLDQSIADEIADEGFTAIIRRSPDERGAHVKALKMRMDAIKGILAQYVELAEKDQSGCITGWILRRKLIRAVTSESEAMALTRRQFGDDAVYAALDFSVARLEEYLHDDRKITKKEAKERVSAALKPILTYKKSDNFLAESRSL